MKKHKLLKDTFAFFIENINFIRTGTDCLAAS